MNTTTLHIAEIVLSVILVALILLQQRSQGAGGLLGGGGGGDGVYQTRRGLERIVFYATIVCAVLFAGLAVAQLLIAR